MHLDPVFMLLAGLLAVVGLCSGFIAGLLGVGGGILIVPMLYFLFGVFEVPEHLRAQLATGTSLAIVVMLAFRATCSHTEQKAVDFDLLRRWAPAVAIGALGGSLLSGLVFGKLAAGVFASVALTTAIQMTFAKEGTHLRASLPVGIPAHGLAGLIGALSASAGIAGGSLMVPTLTLCTYPLRRAIGTSAAFGMIIAVAGVSGFLISGWGTADLPPWSIGYVSLPALLIIAPISLMTVRLGVRKAHSINPKHLRRVFALILLITAARMFYEFTL